MRSLTYLTRRRSVSTTAYQLTDRLHEGRTAYVSADEIVSAVSTWLAELTAHSPFVEDLARGCGTATGGLRIRLRIACPLT